jgi:hypothetical protein
VLTSREYTKHFLYVCIYVIDFTENLKNSVWRRPFYYYKTATVRLPFHEQALEPSRYAPFLFRNNRTRTHSSKNSMTRSTIKVSVRADNANNGWTNSGMMVRKGQRLRIRASGRVSLGDSLFASPDGVSTLAANDILMRTEATGALISAIGDDNDAFILIEFSSSARRCSISGSELRAICRTNTGTFEVIVEAEAGGHWNFGLPTQAEWTTGFAEEVRLVEMHVRSSGIMVCSFELSTCAGIVDYKWLIVGFI